MSTTVTYKGSTLTTVNNNTKTLKTAGKYMEGDVVLTDVSGGTSAISVVDTIDSHGGTIREITALDISDTTAVASDVAQGKYFYTSAGVKTAGTATGGGTGGNVWQDSQGFVHLDDEGGGSSGGLEYEMGTLTLSSDESTPIISFTNTHTDVPIYINITDVTETLATDNSNLYWTFMNWYTLNNSFIKTTSSSNIYGRYQYGWKTSSGASAGNIDCTNTGTSSTSLYYLVESTRFGPYCGSNNRYWRAGRTYKWIAVWAPTA